MIFKIIFFEKEKMLSEYSFLFPLFVPVYYKLSLPYYLGFVFLIFSGYLLKNKKTILNEIFEYLSFIYLVSLYIWNNMYLSYMIILYCMVEYHWFQNINLYENMFFLCFLVNWEKNKYLYIPFLIYLYKMLNRESGEKVGNVVVKDNIVFRNLILTSFFFMIGEIN